MDAARDGIITGGIESVKVERLAVALHATRAAFYYHFKNREQLLDELLQDWEENNTRPFENIIRSKAQSGMDELNQLIQIWLEEKDYSPAFDSAVRDWARTSNAVAKRVKRVDKKRIAILKKIFLDLGFSDQDAFIRARITYFHQVGYYTLGLDESKKRRYELAPIYVQALIRK